MVTTPAFPPAVQQTPVSDGVVSFTFRGGLFPGCAVSGKPASYFDYPISSCALHGFLVTGVTMDLSIVDGELSGDITVGNAAQGGDFCELHMTGTDGNWSGDWDCGNALPPPNGTIFSMASFTAIPFQVEPGHEHEHDKVSER